MIAAETWFAITARNDQEWEALARVIGRDDLLADPRFATVAGRYEHHDELDEAISAWCATQDPTTAFHTLQQGGVTAAPQFTEAMLADDPHVAARGWIKPMTSRDVGTHPHIGHAFRGVPQAWDRGSPVLGEDNDYVFRKVLQLDDEEYQRHVDARVIVDDYLDADMNPV